MFFKFFLILFQVKVIFKYENNILYNIFKMAKKNRPIKYSKKIINIFNVSLALMSFLLLLNLFNVNLPHIGYAVYDFLDQEEPNCFISYREEFNQISMSHCCNEARKQLTCERQFNTFGDLETDIICFTGQSSLSYHLNNQAYRYCRDKGII